MERISAKDALNYAFSSEMLNLYGVLLLADIMLFSGVWLGANWATRGGTSGLIGQIAGPVLLLVGFVLGIGGFVAFIYKVVADANRAAE